MVVASQKFSSLVRSDCYHIIILLHKISIHSLTNSGAACSFVIKESVNGSKIPKSYKNTEFIIIFPLNCAKVLVSFAQYLRYAKA